MVDVAILITDYDWQESDRPTLTISEDRLFAALTIGTEVYIELSAKSPEDMKDQLDGYAQIFQKAALVAVHGIPVTPSKVDTEICPAAVVRDSCL